MFTCIKRDLKCIIGYRRTSHGEPISMFNEQILVTRNKNNQYETMVFSVDGSIPTTEPRRRLKSLI